MPVVQATEFEKTRSAGEGLQFFRTLDEQFPTLESKLGLVVGGESPLSFGSKILSIFIFEESSNFSSSSQSSSSKNPLIFPLLLNLHLGRILSFFIFEEFYHSSYSKNSRIPSFFVFWCSIVTTFCVLCRFLSAPAQSSGGTDSDYPDLRQRGLNLKFFSVKKKVPLPTPVVAALNNSKLQ
jgi:hypothetical protein